MAIVDEITGILRNALSNSNFPDARAVAIDIDEIVEKAIEQAKKDGFVAGIAHQLGDEAKQEYSVEKAVAKEIFDEVELLVDGFPFERLTKLNSYVLLKGKYGLGGSR